MPYAHFMEGVTSVHGVDLNMDYHAYCLRQAYYALAGPGKPKWKRGKTPAPIDELWPTNIRYSFECASVDRATEAWTR